MTEPARRPAGLPNHASATPEGIARLTDDAIERATRIVEDALTPEPAGTDPLATLLDRISDAARLIWTAYGAGGVLAPVHPDPAVRAAAEEATVRIEAWRAAVTRDGRILAALEDGDPTSLDPEAAAVLHRWIAAMRLAGAHLDAPVRAELDALSTRVAELQGAFAGAAAADAAGITVDASRLAGLSPEVIAGLHPGDEPNSVVLPLGLRQIVLERALDRGVREAILRRWLDVAAEANRSALAEISAAHRRTALLLGRPSWLDLRAAGGMLGSAASVDVFLGELEPPFLAARNRALDAIRPLLARELGMDPSELVIEDWDVARGLRLLRDERTTDGDPVDADFPLDAVLEGLAAATEAAFGVRIEGVPGAAGWHADVRRLDCTDVATGRAIGTILLDPLARDGKITGVAGMCDLVAIGGVGPDGIPEPTHVTIVTFFARPADGETARLTFGDIEALFHELGHALDFMLGSSRFAPLDSEAWIRDWSEAPSQFVGRWASLPEVLAGLGRDRATGRPLTAAQADTIARSNESGAVLDLLRFLWFARLDRALSGETDVDLDAAWRDAWAVRATPLVTDAFRPSPLAILAFGYDGAMYGFLWAQALLEEIVAAFRHDGPLKPEIGRRYRSDLLEPGWAADPAARMRRFLGREPSIAAYLERLAR
jgi:thimet oligopeptidase